MNTHFRLFIVEDSQAILDRLIRSISDLEEVDVVGSALDVAPAIAGVNEMHPDALILDLHLPSGNGLDVLRAIRKSHPNLHVMVFTNFAADAYRTAAMAIGADEFLDKNADFPRVREILARWADARRASRTTH
jgi:DNA-binding NarL/FixJ family response regulator